MNIELNKIIPDPNNPRKEFDPIELRKLEESINTIGIKNPLVVEKMGGGKYLLLDGERRYRAATNLKLKEVPVTIEEPMSESQRTVLRFQLQERHSQWTVWEKAQAMSDLQDSLKLSIREISNILGISTSIVQKYISILALSKPAARQLSSLKLPFDWIVEISMCLKASPDQGTRKELETALVDKIKNKVIMKNREIRYYRHALQSGKGVKVLGKILNDEKYTPDMAALDSGTSGVADIRTTQAGATDIILHGAKVISARPRLSTHSHDKFVEAKKILDKIVALDYGDEE